MNNKTYDRLKFVVQIVLPATATLYFALSQIWGLPKSEEMVGTISAITTFLGIILGISNKRWNNSDDSIDGLLDLSNSDTRVLDLKTTPENNDDILRIKVRK